jgi:hypothetical protein
LHYSHDEALSATSASLYLWNRYAEYGVGLVAYPIISQNADYHTTPSCPCLKIESVVLCTLLVGTIDSAFANLLFLESFERLLAQRII